MSRKAADRLIIIKEQTGLIFIKTFPQSAGEAAHFTAFALKPECVGRHLA